jgi:FkbM family methyltransferase
LDPHRCGNRGRLSTGDHGRKDEGVIGKRMLRRAMLAWGRWGRASGYRYQWLDRHGAKLAEKELLPARLPNGSQVLCDLRDHVQRQIWFNGAYEPVETYLFSQLLQPGMTVLDIGANVGQYTLIASTAVGPSGQVHSFEPVPSTFARLQRHVELNQLANVTLNQAALWFEDAPLKLGLAPESANNLGSYSVGAAQVQETAVSALGIRLETYALMEKLTRLDLVKMDIEGAELFALQGGRALLDRFHPVILMEVNREALGKLNTDPESLWQFVADLGYSAWQIGFSPETSGPIANFNDLDQANVLLYTGPLPKTVTSGWNYRQVMQWAGANQ